MPSAIDVALSHAAFAAALVVDIIAGGVALYLYWRTAMSRKGSTTHRRNGRRFFLSMIVVGVTVGPVLFATPGEFDPAYVMQFGYMAVCLFTIVWLGWASIRWKHDVDRFRRPPFLALGIALTAFGLALSGVAIANGSWLTFTFALIGLVFGPPMIRFALLKAELQPRWWMTWHLNAVCGLFNAVHANLLAVLYEHLIDPTVGDGAILTTHLGTAAIALLARTWLGGKYAAPMRFVQSPEGNLLSRGSGARGSPMGHA